MAVYKRGGTWWYRFVWNDEPIRESAKTSNKRVAEEIEAARKAASAKGEVGIRDRAYHASEVHGARRRPPSRTLGSQ